MYDRIAPEREIMVIMNQFDTEGVGMREKTIIQAVEQIQSYSMVFQIPFAYNGQGVFIPPVHQWGHSLH